MWLRKSFGRTACYTGSQILAKDMSVELSDVMDSVVKVVNIVKKSALQTRLFSNLCAAEKNTLRYCTILRFDGFHVEQCCHVCWNYARLFGSFYFSFTSPLDKSIC